MQLLAALEPLRYLTAAFIYGIFPTIFHVVKNPALIFNLAALRHYYFASIWLVFGPIVDEGSKDTKHQLLSNATGVVLEIGAGHGRSMYYLNKEKVTKYVAVEPNTDMHPVIRQHAAAAGFDEGKGEILILGCGAGDLGIINSALGGDNQADVLVSILTLCSVPGAKQVVSDLCSRSLKPGGQFLFYEHVLSRRDDVKWWQRTWSPVWSRFFEGCNLDQPTDLWVLALDIWDKDASKTWGRDDLPEENFLWHQAGMLVKRKD